MCSSGSGPQKSTHNNKVGLLVCEEGEKRKKRERRTKIEDHWDTAHNIKKSQDTKKTPRLLAHALWAPTSLVEVELQVHQQESLSPTFTVK
jgi:hypothetical protein